MKTTNEHEIFKGLSDPTRLQIMVLLGVGELCVCDLVKALAIPQSTVSRHLSILKKYRLVEDRRDRKWIHYRLSKSKLLEELKGYFDNLAKSDQFADLIEKVIECKDRNKC